MLERNLIEKQVAKYCDVRYGVAVNSATSALHIACLALGLKEGDWIWTSPNSFVASANCVLYQKATPVFCDCDERYQIDINDIKKKITKNFIKKTFKKKPFFKKKFIKKPVAI